VTLWEIEEIEEIEDSWGKKIYVKIYVLNTGKIIKQTILVP
jgi:hypothetical protein